MIRWALGGLLGLAALLVVWLRLLGAGVPEALAPAGASMRTVDLGTLAGDLELPEPRGGARWATEQLEERLAASELPLPGDIGDVALPLASAKEAGAAGGQPPAEAPAEGEAEAPNDQLDPARAAFLIRRMLTVYRRTSGLE